MKLLSLSCCVLALLGGNPLKRTFTVPIIIEIEIELPRKLPVDPFPRLTAFIFCMGGPRYICVCQRTSEDTSFIGGSDFAYPHYEQCPDGLHYTPHCVTYSSENRPCPTSLPMWICDGLDPHCLGRFDFNNDGSVDMRDYGWVTIRQSQDAKGT